MVRMFKLLAPVLDMEPLPCLCSDRGILHMQLPELCQGRECPVPGRDCVRPDLLPNTQVVGSASSWLALCADKLQAVPGLGYK